MKYMKYIAFLAAIVLAELALIYGMFAFVGASKLYFVLASIVLIAGALAYLVVSRHRERSKVKPKAEVWNGYAKVVFVFFSVFLSALAAAVLIRGIVFLVRGS
jgi:hypothetical protein